MEILLETIKILLPSLVVFFTAYYSIKLLTKNEQEKKTMDIKAKSQKEIILLRLQAYERLILLLERISPSALIMRLGHNELSSYELHLKLLTEIRSEFNHNITQQLYISTQAWKIVYDTKEEIAKMINIAKEKLPKDGTIKDFSKAIIESDLVNHSPTGKAIEFLKSEAQSIF